MVVGTELRVIVLLLLLMRRYEAPWIDDAPHLFPSRARYKSSLCHLPSDASQL